MLAASGLSVYVGNRRQNIDAINYGESKIPAIILDDGFQNPGIKKDISLIIFDEDIGVGNGMLLPSGPLRETLWSGIGRTNAVLINQGDFGKSSVRILKMAKRRKKPVFFIKKEMDTAGLFGKYVAFAGIGYPDKFFDALRGVISMRIVEKVPFPDHHYYTKGDILTLFRLSKKYGARLVCTEKDWVKLPRNIQSKVKYVPLKVALQPNFYLWLEKKLAACRGMETEAKD